MCLSLFISGHIRLTDEKMEVENLVNKKNLPEFNWRHIDSFTVYCHKITQFQLIPRRFF